MDTLWRHAELEQAAATLDFTKPVAVMLLGILHHLEDADDPWGIVAGIVNGVPSRGYVAPTPASAARRHPGFAGVNPVVGALVAVDEQCLTEQEPPGRATAREPGGGRLSAAPPSW